MSHILLCVFALYYIAIEINQLFQVSLFKFKAMLFLLGINIFALLIFIAILLILQKGYNLKIMYIIDIYMYLRYVCNLNTISLIFYFLNLGQWISITFMLCSFIIIAHIYDIVYSYGILSFRYINTNNQFRKNNTLILNQIAHNLINVRCCDIMCSHQIMVSESSEMLLSFQEKDIVYRYLAYYDDLSITNGYDFHLLFITELLNLLIFFLINIYCKKLLTRFVYKKNVKSFASLT